MTLGSFQPCENCCTVPCDSCSGGVGPVEFQVTISGILEGLIVLCPNCTEYVNGTFVLPNAGPCTWEDTFWIEYDEGGDCEPFEVSVTLSGGGPYKIYVQLNWGSAAKPVWSIWSKSYEELPPCLTLSDTIPLALGYLYGCDGRSANACTVTAL